MDYLFGCTNRDPSLLKSRLAKMEAAIQALGYGPALYWQSGDTAFAIASSRGRQPPLDRLVDNNRWSLVFSGLLYNERELIAELDLEPHASDASIAAAGISRYGLDFAARMNGDWTCAAFDKSDQSLHLLRDQTGSSSLLYRQRDNELTFGSTVHIFTATEKPAISGAFILGTQFGHCMPDDLTIYEGVNTLFAAHRLHWNNAELQLHQYWQPTISPIRYPNLEDYDAHFCELYGRAVEDRIRRAPDAVGLTLSGGFDSGSVGVWAGDAMARHRPGQAMHTYSYVPFDVSPGSELDERPAIDAALAACGHTRPTIIGGEETTLVQSMQTMFDEQIEPYYAPISHLYLHLAVKAASRDNTGLLLTGQMGNATVSRAVAIELAQQGRGALKPASWKEWRQRSLTGIAAAYLPQSVRAALYRRRLPQPEFKPKTSLHRDFQHDSARLRHWSGTDIAGLRQRHDDHHRSANRIERRMQLGNGRLLRLWGALAASYGLYTSDPTIDPRVVEFCLNIPVEVYGTSPANDRQLIRRAMAHRMPEAVLQRKRVIQGSDLDRRIQRESAELVAMAKELASDPLVNEWWDMAQIISVLSGESSEKDRIKQLQLQSQTLGALRAAYWINKVGAVA
jgi:asparagine synthase (glutamine-hydrolysing)